MHARVVLFLLYPSTTGGHISIEPRINERIRVPEVRLVGPAGEQVGIVRIDDALKLAMDADLDLVEVAPDSKPPVCKIMDYGKFKYEAAVKARETRKNQVNTVIKEMKLRPKIDQHDYETKKGHVERFLKQGDKVKITIMFRGREQSRPELGYKLLQRLAQDIGEIAIIESAPLQDGRNMTMVLGPARRKTSEKSVKPARPALVVEEPLVSAPVVEAPVVEAPVVETPVVETPVVETPVVETLVVEAPVKKAAAKKAPAKKAVAPKEEAPKDEAAKEAPVKKAPAKKTAAKKAATPVAE